MAMYNPITILNGRLLYSVLALFSVFYSSQKALAESACVLTYETHRCIDTSEEKNSSGLTGDGTKIPADSKKKLSGKTVHSGKRVSHERVILDPIASDLYDLYVKGVSVGEAVTLFKNQYSIAVTKTEDTKENKSCTLSFRKIPDEVPIDQEFKVGVGKIIDFGDKKITFILVHVLFDTCRFNLHYDNFEK